MFRNTINTEQRSKYSHASSLISEVFYDSLEICRGQTFQHTDPCHIFQNSLLRVSFLQSYFLFCFSLGKQRLDRTDVLYTVLEHAL